MGKRRLYHDHGIYDGLGTPIPARASQAMVDAREPMGQAPRPRCTHAAGCLRDAERERLCVGHWEDLHNPLPEEEET